MEKLQESVDAVLIPVGGGGLLAGMSIVFKHMLPDTQVIVSWMIASRLQGLLFVIAHYKLMSVFMSVYTSCWEDYHTELSSIEDAITSWSRPFVT